MLCCTVLLTRTNLRIKIDYFFNLKNINLNKKHNYFNNTKDFDGNIMAKRYLTEHFLMAIV